MDTPVLEWIKKKKEEEFLNILCRHAQHIKGIWDLHHMVEFVQGPTSHFEIDINQLITAKAQCMSISFTHNIRDFKGL